MATAVSIEIMNNQSDCTSVCYLYSYDIASCCMHKITTDINVITPQSETLENVRLNKLACHGCTFLSVSVPRPQGVSKAVTKHNICFGNSS